MDCVFCKILNKELNADFLHEDENYIVIKDIHPKAPAHVLIIPKKHIESINTINKDDKELVGGLIILAKEMVIKLKIDKSGYKLVFNVGRGGGQLIDHLHLHLLGGWNNNPLKIEV